MTNSRSHTRPLVLLVLVVAMLPATPALAADPQDPQIGGIVTISGTDGRDELTVEITSFRRLTVTPAATVTSTRGNCAARPDPLTGRPVENRCHLMADDHVDLVVDGRGGDDVLDVQDPDQIARTIAVSGAAGNDVLVAVGLGRTLKGGDGDDSMRAPGGQPDGRVNWDGGAGRDLADFSGATSYRVIPGVHGQPDTVQLGGPEPGVTASLPTGQATFLVAQTSSGPINRQDSLAGIERLSGTSTGDILTGGNGAEELLGQGGPDILKGGDGDDSVNGGPANDDLAGGKGANTLDGGPGRDDFPTGTGADTFLTRDGFAESVACVSNDVIINDLTDKAASPEKCASISTAARKHRFDTRLSSRALRVGGDRMLRVGVSCPRAKPDRCVGTLNALLGRARLARARYSLRPGRGATLRLALSAGEAARVRGRALSLRADEVDGDGRDRRVVRALSVRRR
jgi:hypothetical protein